MNCLVTFQTDEQNLETMFQWIFLRFNFNPVRFLLLIYNSFLIYILYSLNLILSLRNSLSFTFKATS